MKNLNTKSLMVITIIFSSVFVMPMAVFGQEKDYDDVLDLNQVDVGIFEGFSGGFGALFGNHLGYGGRILGSIFEALFLNDFNLSKFEMLGSTFVLSVNRTFREYGTYNFDDELDTRDIYVFPQEYVDNPENELITGVTSTNMGHAYCIVDKHGEFDYVVEVGVAATLIIWDSDKSFITAVSKLLNFFRRILTYQDEGIPINQEIIREGVSLLTWFLIHINDIFTGDELFIMNPITWQRLDIIPSAEVGKEFSITKSWYLTGNDTDHTNNQNIESDVLNGPALLDFWNATAQSKRDSYTQWLLTPTHGNIAETFWTQFSFDLIQLWIKNFEIHIDVGEILEAVGGGGGSPEVLIANAFKGCNIEFYLFTHHLAGAFLYNDTDASQDITAIYTPVDIDPATTVNIPTSTELTHRLILGQVYGGFQFVKPTIDPSNKSISWGINILNSEISAVPLGVDLNSYLDAPKESISYIHFGFTFEPKIDRELGAAHGLVKLNQFFAPWNDPNSPYANSPIPGLDLAIIYVSTVLHFELAIATQGEIPEAPETILDQSHYNRTEKKLMVGNYIGARAQDELEFVDIAGYDYEYGSELSKTTAPASTSIIPLAVWLMEHERHDSYVIAGGEEVSTFASDIRVQTELSVMVYAVCYPQFEDGSGIWHDPTFSVFMVFEGEGFWALIVLIAGVGLVGVATILIKRRKDRRF
ncbi:MAG: hypothetical protein ACFFCY_16900 [Promethearchaeota archaeon]